MASLCRKRPGQHFLQSPASRTFSIRDLNRLTEDDARALFQKLRWPDTDGDPVCPHCGCLDHWNLAKQKKFKCKAAECHKQFSITSGTVFAYRKMTFKDMLAGIRAFSGGAKGASAIALSKDLGCDYKTAFAFMHKLREGMMHSMKDIRLEGTVETDGCYVGGYVKPENTKINRVDRRLAINRNGKRRVVVGVRERGEGGLMIVNVFDQEGDSVPWIIENVDRGAFIMADEAPGWDDIHASHQAGRINHSERYAEGIINTNQMESFFSRLRRCEVGSYHHISGPYLLRYAHDAAWRENNRRKDDKTRAYSMLQSCLAAPPSRTFGGYWQRRGPREIAPTGDNFFANFA